MHSVLAILHVERFRGTRLLLYCAAPSIICYLEWLLVIGAYILSRLSYTRSQYIAIDNNCVPCRDHLSFVVLVTLAKQSVKVFFIILPVSLGYFVYFIMPPRKRTAKEISAPAMPSIRPNKRARRRRLRPDDVPIVTPTIEPKSADSRQAPEALGTESVDVGAITATISSVLSQAIKWAFAPEKLASILSAPAQQKQQLVTQDAFGVVDQAVDDDVIAITMNTAQSGTAGALVNTDHNDPRPQNLFTSISFPLTSRVSFKIKAKTWANEFISFGPLIIRFSSGIRKILLVNGTFSRCIESTSINSRALPHF